MKIVNSLNKQHLNEYNTLKIKNQITHNYDKKKTNYETFTNSKP